MIAQNLISIARSRLGDEDKHRWTDSRLMTILDQGQKDFCKLSGVYRKITVIPLAIDGIKYPLPVDAMTINRIEYKGKIIPLFSRNDIDALRLSTKEFVGIKDNLNMNFLEVYPTSPTPEGALVDTKEGFMSSDEFILSDPFGVVTELDSPYVLLDEFGVVTFSDYNQELLEPSTGYGEVCDTSENKPYLMLGNIYGVVTEVESTDSPDAQKGFITSSEVYEVIGKFGLVTSIVQEDGYMRIFYTAIPAMVTNLAQELVLPDIWEAAMVRYIVGTALQDDNDANNIQRGELELSKYVAEVKKAEDLTSKDFSRGQPDKMTTRFRRV